MLNKRHYNSCDILNLLELEHFKKSQNNIIYNIVYLTQSQKFHCTVRMNDRERACTYMYNGLLLYCLIRIIILVLQVNIIHVCAMLG